MVSNVVFTMNRPLQLYAYIESLRACLPGVDMQTYVLYRKDNFDEQYREVFSRFPHVSVIAEQDFHDDLYDLLMGLDTPYVLFGTDDVVYFDGVDFEVVDRAFRTHPETTFGFSMRLAPGTLPDSENCERIEIAGQAVYRINWKTTKDKTAKYPFELDSTFYTTDLVRRILKPVAGENRFLQRLLFESLLGRVLRHFSSMKDLRAGVYTYHKPNTFEGHCYRWCKAHKRLLPSYLLFQRLCASALQVNRVNTEVDNAIDGSQEHTVEAINEKFKQGYRLDIQSLQKNKPTVTHVGRECFRLERAGNKGDGCSRD